MKPALNLGNIAVLVTFYAAAIAVVGCMAVILVSALRQTGGFPSSRQDMEEMAKRVDQDRMKALQRRCLKIMGAAWLLCMATAITVSIYNTVRR